jgi:hypothetical protein
MPDKKNEPRHICLFGELDAYTSPFPPTNSALTELINELKVACLLYDEVIINTNALFDHALTLPAFELLSPLTQKGLLWTSSRSHQRSPEDYIMVRAQKVYGEHLNQGINKKGHKTIKMMIERWQTIAPNNFRLTRTKHYQPQTATRNILTNLKRLTPLSKQAQLAQKRLLDLTQIMRANGVFDRNEMIARLGNLRDLLNAQELTIFALIIQGEYMNQGVHNENNVDICLYPGKYMQYLQKHARLFFAQPLKIDHNSYQRVQQGLTSAGLSLQQIIDRDTYAFCELSQSPQWKNWRRRVTENHASKYYKEETQALIHLLQQYNATNKTTSIPTSLDQTICTTKQSPQTSLRLPTDWLPSGLGLMGHLIQEQTKTTKTVPVYIDLSSRVLTYQQHTIILEKLAITLLSLFASVHNTGVPVEAIKQLELELDLLKRHGYKTWYAQSAENEELSIARLNRLNVAKNRLNKKLKALDLAIQVKTGEGLWQLCTRSQQSAVDIRFKHTSWILHTALIQQNNNIPPIKLTKQQQYIWQYLYLRQNTFVASQAIALELDKPTANSKQISDMLYKLKQRLVGQPYQLLRSYQGEYCLLKVDEALQADEQATRPSSALA